MNHYDLRNSPSSDRLREGSRSFAELHLISLISPKANLISIPSRRQHLSFQITDAAVKGIRRDFDILCRRVSSMDEGAALAAACSFVRSFGDGGSGLDSESAPSRTLAPHSPSEREREREREGEKKASCLSSFCSPSVPAERLGILCFTSIFVCSWARIIEEGRRDVILTDFISEFCIWGNAFVSQVHGLPLRMSASVRPQKTFRLTH